MSVIPIMMLLVLGQVQDSQIIPWRDGTDWRLYANTSDNGGKFDRTKARTYHYRSMEADTLVRYLQTVSAIPPEKSNNAIWMGDFFVSCRLKGILKYLRVSRYGGFFVDLDTGIYYELPVEIRALWHAYLSREFMQL